MDEIICHCNGVTRLEIEKAIQDGAKTLDDIKKATDACTGNRCHELNPKGVCCAEDIKLMLPKDKQPCKCCCS